MAQNSIYRLSLLIISLFGLLLSFSKSHEFEISSEVLFAGSPTAMLIEFLNGQEDVSNITQVFRLIPSAAKTAELLQSTQGHANQETPMEFNCDLSGVDAECFLVHMAGMVGTPWGTREKDEYNTRDLITRYLKPQKLTTSVAVLTCISSPVVLSVLETLGTNAGPASYVINESKKMCHRSDIL